MGVRRKHCTPGRPVSMWLNEAHCRHAANEPGQLTSCFLGRELLFRALGNVIEKKRTSSFRQQKTSTGATAALSVHERFPRRVCVMWYATSSVTPKTCTKLFFTVKELFGSFSTQSNAFLPPCPKVQWGSLSFRRCLLLPPSIILTYCECAPSRRTNHLAGCHVHDVISRRAGGVGGIFANVCAVLVVCSSVPPPVLSQCLFVGRYIFARGFLMQLIVRAG